MALAHLTKACRFVENVVGLAEMEVLLTGCWGVPTRHVACIMLLGIVEVATAAGGRLVLYKNAF